MHKVLLFILSPILFFTNFGKKHPYHVGSMEITYSEKSKTFQITGRFFVDDLENAISKQSGKSVRFNDSKSKAQISEALKNYSFENLKMRVNDKNLTLNFIGYEEDQEAVDIFMETEKIESPKKVETGMTFLYNQFKDQINIVHVIINGERKSEKISYPKKYFSLKF